MEGILGGDHFLVGLMELGGGFVEGISELLELTFEGVSPSLELRDLVGLGVVLDMGTEVGKTIEGEDLVVPETLEG